MRALILASVLALASAARAQPLPERPDTPAPAASAPIEQRQAWCQQYAAWFVAHTPQGDQAPDARATHRFEVELNSCTLDPQAYERQTIAEAARTTEAT
jgi:hypothetical protein